MSIISASTTTTTAYKVTADTTGTLVLQTGSTPTTAVTIDGSQNVGLGVTPSSWTVFKAFEIGAAGTGLAGAAGQPVLFSNAYYNGGWRYAANGAAANYDQSSGAHRWFNATSGTAGNFITFTQAMTLNASSNLQLGTTTVSAARLNVFSSDVNKQIVFSNNETYYGSVAHNAATGMNEYRTEATGGHAFFKGTESTAGMTFDSSGNLLVGTTDSSPAAGNGIKLVKNRQGFSEYNAVSVVSNANNAGYSSYELYTSTGTTGYKFYVLYNGGISNFSANNVNLSDRREKTDFEPAGDYLAKICAIPVQTFNYINQGEDDQGKTLGVVAQDVQAVAPELVTETKLGTDGEGETRLAIYQTDLQYALMKCIQEQQAIIETLTNRITALEAK